MRRFAILIAMMAVTACAAKEPQEVPQNDTPAIQPTPVDQAAIAQQSDAIPFDVASDPSARYFLLDVRKGTGGRIVATTRREGSSGISYARREIDCSSLTFRYVGEGETLAEAQKDSPNPGGMGPLVDGSISDVASKFACSKI